MATLSLSTRYRIGPMPARLAAPADPQLRWLAALGLVVVALLIGLVVVLNQAVVRGSELRAAFDKPAVTKLAQVAPRQRTR